VAEEEREVTMPDNPTPACCGEQSGDVACCPSAAPRTVERPWVVGVIETPPGKVPVVATSLTGADMLGAVLVRLGFGREQYLIPPGLYAIGQATPESPVLVSANYKLSFDHLRRELSSLDAWIVVLDTKGINVWCAAGKKTFGTDEVASRVNAVRLPEVVSHRTLILPQLGAPGVAAHQVQKRTGFKVVYGPVRAADIPAFLAAKMQATPEMRRVRFGLGDRAAVIPVEVVHWGKWSVLLAAAFFALSGLGSDGYSLDRLSGTGGRALILLFAGFLGGTVLAPLLLPWLPGRAFSLKGLVLGLAIPLAAAGVGLLSVGTTSELLECISWFLILPAVTAFLSMNFTGSSTYTGLSGVRREMRIAVPAQIVAGLIGLGLWITARFI
jgi:CO dehydrogenase/acetyl-CoA synthase delta subunit